VNTLLRVAFALIACGLALTASSLANSGGRIVSPTSYTCTVFIQECAYFFYLGRVSMSVNLMNTTSARLIVSPIESDLKLGPPIVNVTLSQKSIVVFDVGNRGYYYIELTSPSGKPVEYFLTLSEGGAATDMLTAGTLTLTLGTLLALGVRLKRTHPGSRGQTQKV